MPCPSIEHITFAIDVVNAPGLIEVGLISSYDDTVINVTGDKGDVTISGMLGGLYNVVIV